MPRLPSLVRQRFLWSCALAGALLGAGAVLAEDAPKLPSKPSAPKAPATPSGPSCKLENAESPRGGRLDVRGERFGQAPVVRIAGKVARILERQADRISVQVAADSDGGVVTVQADGKSAECGTLTIIGKDR